MKRFTKYSIIFLFSFVFIAPAIQTFKIVHFKSLDGDFVLSSKPDFTVKNWFSGEFQDQFNKFIEDHIGFRNWFIRLRNEIDYDFFGIPHVGNLVIGKNDVLYQKIYIQAYYGEDYVGDEIIKRKLDKLQVVQDELGKKGIFVMLLIAPGKASIYPEYIPDSLKSKQKNKTNYDEYLKALKQTSINYIDMRHYLKQIKDTSHYALFPKCGIHWSGYAATLVVDTLIKYIERHTNNSFLQFHSSKGKSTDSEFIFTDNDIGNAMNMIWDLKSWNVYYPTITFDKDTIKKKIDILSIGDSFNQSFWGFYPFFDKIFGSNSQYWYYNKIVSWPDSLVTKYTLTETLNYKKEIEKRKIILIVTTEQNLNNFGFSFIDEAYNIYCPVMHYEKVHSDFYNRLKTDSNMYKSIKSKADAHYISFDQAALMDFQWIINNSGTKMDEEIHKKYLDSLQRITVRKK